MKKLNFSGKGSGYLGIWALNFILTIVTLGLYYPWAKEKMRKYIWNETSFKNDRFQFHGTGKEMFKGFIKVYLFFVIFYVALIGAQYSHSPKLLFGVFITLYLALFLLIPFAIFGAWRYRTSRTSWRGIYFSFDAKLSEFCKLYFKELFLTIITFGIYSFWMQINIRKYILNHTKLGNYRFSYTGNGGDYFGLSLLGGFLSVITLYIYIPAFIKSIFEFHVNNTELEGQSFKSTLRNSEIYGVLIVNFLLLIFTLGIAFPWVFIRTMKMYMNNIQLPENVDYDNIKQDADNYTDATGDDFLDTLDLDLDF